MPCVVVRYHEIALKGGNRQRFVQRLMSNLRDATSGLGVRSAHSLPGRVVLRLAEDAAIAAVCERVATTFGVANYSAGVELPVDLDTIRDAVLACARAEPFATFGIRTRRADKSFPMTSPELSAVLGAAVLEQVLVLLPPAGGQDAGAGQRRGLLGMLRGRRRQLPGVQPFELALDRRSRAGDGDDGADFGEHEALPQQCACLETCGDAASRYAIPPRRFPTPGGRNSVAASSR